MVLPRNSRKVKQSVRNNRFYRNSSNNCCCRHVNLMELLRTNRTRQCSLSNTRSRRSNKRFQRVFSNCDCLPQSCYNYPNECRTVGANRFLESNESLARVIEMRSMHTQCEPLLQNCVSTQTNGGNSSRSTTQLNQQCSIMEQVMEQVMEQPSNNVEISSNLSVGRINSSARVISRTSTTNATESENNTSQNANNNNNNNSNESNNENNQDDEAFNGSILVINRALSAVDYVLNYLNDPENAIQDERNIPQGTNRVWMMGSTENNADEAAGGDGYHNDDYNPMAYEITLRALINGDSNSEYSNSEDAEEAEDDGEGEAEVEINTDNENDNNTTNEDKP